LHQKTSVASSIARFAGLDLTRISRKTLEFLIISNVAGVSEGIALIFAATERLHT